MAKKMTNKQDDFSEKEKMRISGYVDEEVYVGILNIVHELSKELSKFPGAPKVTYGMAISELYRRSKLYDEMMEKENEYAGKKD